MTFSRNSTAPTLDRLRDCVKPPPRSRRKSASRHAKNESQAHHDSNPVDVNGNIHREVVIEKNGTVRQAGASTSDGEFVKLLRSAAEANLFFFAKHIMLFSKMTAGLHKPLCSVIQKLPPYRKLILMPRDTYKSTLVAKALPVHILIQGKENNCYFPGKDGAELAGLIACETESKAKKHLRHIATHFETNELLRALWPHRVWQQPKKESTKWSEKEILLPRTLAQAQSDASLEAIGVGGAVTGGHYDFIIKDDIATFEAANSPTLMKFAIDWHELTRPLLKEESSLEFTSGTRWAIHDIYSHIEQTDPTVQVYTRSIIEDGKIIFPEDFSPAHIENLRKSLGAKFQLLYMNNASNPELVDFDESQLRYYLWNGNEIIPQDDARDRKVMERLGLVSSNETTPRSMTIQEYVAFKLGKGETHFRVRLGV